MIWPVLIVVAYVVGGVFFMRTAVATWNSHAENYEKLTGDDPTDYLIIGVMLVVWLPWLIIYNLGRWVMSDRKGQP